MIQNQLVKIPSARLLAHVLMDRCCAQLLQCEGVRQRFAATLNGKGNIRVANAKPLAVNCTDRDAPTVRIDAGQLRNVAGHFAVRVALALPVDILNVLCEALEIGNDKLIAECFRYQDNVVRDDAAREKEEL